MESHCRLLILASLLAAGCYAPDYPDGRPCSPDGSCPGDLVCDRSFLCLSPELVGDEPPPDPLPEPISSYGAFCGEGNPCLDGLICYFDPNDAAGLGFCTPQCGDGSGAVDDGVCLFISNSPGAQCVFSESRDLGPMFCGTLCAQGDDQACPAGLECREDEWVGALVCQVPLG